RRLADRPTARSVFARPHEPSGRTHGLVSVPPAAIGTPLPDRLGLGCKPSGLHGHKPDDAGSGAASDFLDAASSEARSAGGPWDVMWADRTALPHNAPEPPIHRHS